MSENEKPNMLRDFIKSEFTDKGYTDEQTLAAIKNWGNRGWPKPEVDCYKPGVRCNLRQWDSSLIMEGAYYDCPECGKHFRFIMDHGTAARNSYWELKNMGKVENAWFRYRTGEFSDPIYIWPKMMLLMLIVIIIAGVVQSF